MGRILKIENFPDEYHRRLKEMAIAENTTIREMTIRIIGAGMAMTEKRGLKNDIEIHECKDCGIVMTGSGVPSTCFKGHEMTVSNAQKALRKEIEPQSDGWGWKELAVVGLILWALND